VAHVRLLLAPIAVTRTSDISESLLLPLTVVTGYMTSDDCCYCWACDTHAVATSLHSSDEHSDNSDPSLMAPIVETDKRFVATRLLVATGYLISMVCRY
jgi:hypothetical protein